MGPKIKVLFMCGGNSCRSQMAEGFLRSMGGDLVEVFSAGVNAGGVHPKTIQVMNEAGIDISRQTSKTVADLGLVSFDIVITLCGAACDFLASTDPGDGSDDDQKKPKASNLLIGAPTRIHWPIPDPAEAEGSEEQILAAFREARDAVKHQVEVLLDFGYLYAISTQRQQMSKLADLLNEGIVAHDESRHIFIFNQAAERITGRPRKEVLGKNCHDVFPPNGLCGTLCQFQKGPPEKKERQEYRVVVSASDGTNKRLKMTTEPMSIETGKQEGVLAILYDDTEVSELRWKLEERQIFHGMVGISASMQEIFRTIRSVAVSDYPVLITGESGTGKELVAAAIHKESRRKAGPFVPVNCGALPANILESELFGHVRGAFTGAIREKKGRFELADGGTLFLDEVGELPPAFQVKLLRVLQEKRFERVGGEKSISVDVKVVSATNRDIRQMVHDGSFREDLYYRLCVVPLHLPPLRDRKEDIPFLVKHILETIGKESGKKNLSVSNEAMEYLLRHSWHGNIRELINALQFASIHSSGGTIDSISFTEEIRQGDSSEGYKPSLPAPPLPNKPGSVKKTKLNRENVLQALEKTGYNKVQAAKLLGIGRATLYRFLKDHPI